MLASNRGVRLRGFPRCSCRSDTTAKWIWIRSQNVKRTLVAGIAPAVNMDTGYTNLLTSAERREF